MYVYVLFGEINFGSMVVFSESTDWLPVGIKK